MGMRRINGIGLDGTTVAVTIGRVQVVALKASYADKLETSPLTEMGSQSIDVRTPGNYVTEEVSLTFEAVRFRSELLPRLQSTGFGNEKLPIVVSFVHPDLGDDSDLLTGCRITNLSQAVENSNKALEVELKLTTDQIFWGNDRRTINSLDPSVPLDPSGF